MIELKICLYQAAFTPCYPCRGGIIKSFYKYRFLSRFFTILPCMLAWSMVRACSLSLIHFPRRQHVIKSLQSLSYFGFILIVCDFMTELKICLYQTSFNASHLAGEGLQNALIQITFLFRSLVICIKQVFTITRDLRICYY
jgi:hypothetical protein